MLGSKKIDTINNSNIEKEREERLPQGIQSANGLKARVGAKKGVC